MVITRHLRIAGRVQGVGFRDALATQARKLGVRGWVRNRRDGSVEAVAQGERANVEALVAWAHRGPPAARVTQVVAQPAEGELLRSYAGFDWLPTA